MVHKFLLSAVAALAVATLPVQADDAFRLHRYDSFQATPVTEQSIVFVGNSITNMQPWAELFNSPNVVNRGNSGGFSWEILANVQSFITCRPAKVFIMIGTNDMNVAGYTPEATVANVRQAVKHIKKESPNTEVYIESVMPSTNGSRTVAKGQELNAQLKAMATEMGATFVDYFDALMGCTNQTQSYDNLHPHVAGVKAWTDAVASYVGGNAVLPTNPTVSNGGQSNSYGARLSVFGQLPVTSNDVLFIGDEFVHSGEWQELLGNPNVKNRGTGWGKWGPDINFQTTSVPIILQGLTDNAQPKQVLLMIGSGNLTSASVNLEDVKTKYEACINAISAAAPNTKISLVSIIPYGKNATTINRSKLVPFNEWLQEQADALVEGEYIDLYSVLTDGNNEALDKYIDANQYVTGLGYQACARVLAKYIDGCKVMTEAEAETYYNLIAARTTLSNTLDAVELSGISASTDSYYTLLANKDAAVSNLQTAAAEVEELLKPVPGKWYTMSAKRNTSMYFAKAASGVGFVATSTLDDNGSTYWQLADRGDGTYDLQNGQGYYAVPTATHNVQLNLSTSQPSAGWSLDKSAVTGAFNVTAKVGTANVNCCMNLTSSNTIFNWITNRTTDTGCQIVFAPADFTPVENPDTYNVPFQRVTITDGQMTGAQWWYTMKLKDLFYLYDNGTANYMSLNRSTTSGDDDEQWAFAGSDQKGYTIYNRKYGTAKVLAAPSTISGDNGSTYVTLVDANNVPAGYETRWQFTPSTHIEGAYYMYQFEQPSHAVNNFGGNGKLSFWLGGKDAGSSILFAMAEAILPLAKADGSFYRGGALTTTGWVSQWKSNATEPFQVTFGTSPNNMNATTMGIAVGQQSAPWSFTLSSQDYYVQSYSFDIKAGSADQAITPNGGTATSLNTGSYTTISWQNDEGGKQTASFTYTGSNKESAVQNMVISVRPVTVAPEPQVNVFEYGNAGNSIVYRIPAIAKAYNGDIIAVADYRYGGADIGFGRVSLHARISADGGATWGDKIVVAESHQGQYGVDKANDLEAGFGDPAIVADRESGNVLLLSCCGNVSYPAATWAHHQGIARFRSSDNGKTWSTYEDIAPAIYQQFKDAGVDVQGLFIGSGRIFQSRTTKVGQYYRLYAVCLLRTASTGGLNYVLYSDDFGENWQILGDDATPGVTGGDEPKAEELPDGSILLSSRAYGRIFNIFQFTDVAAGEGSWMTQSASNANNKGVVAEGNSCNGEIMIVPVVRKADNKKMWLALQSVPFGPGGRYNVGIYYKGLPSFAEFATPAAFAGNWEGRHQASYMSSAYSTMTVQTDNTLGFLYEESTFGKDYTIVYKNYSIEQITDSLYTFDASPINSFAIAADGVEAKTTGVAFSSYVGGVKESSRATIDAAISTFKSTPTADNYVAINNAVKDAERVEFDPNVRYIFRNVARGTQPGSLAMVVSDATNLKLTSGNYSATSELQQWSFVPTETDGVWNLYNAQTKSWVMNTLATETAMVTTTDATKAGTYRIQGNNDRLCLVCTAPTNATYPAIHLAGDNTRMVCWTTAGEASQWFFELTDTPADNPYATALSSPITTTVNSGVATLSDNASFKYVQRGSKQDLRFEKFTLNGQPVGTLVIKGMTNREGTISATQNAFFEECAGTQGETLNDQGGVPVKLEGSIDLDNKTLKAIIDITTDDQVRVVAAPVTTISDTEMIATGVQNVKLNRTFKEGWNTVCLPFEWTVAMMSEADEVQVFSTYQNDIISFSQKTDAVAANTPCLVHFTAANAAPYYFGANVQSLTPQEVSNNGATFKGNYEAGFDMNGKYGVVINEGVSKIMLGTSGATINPARAYFDITSSAGVREMAVTLEGHDSEPTAINGVKMQGSDAPIYNLQGIKTNGKGHGVFIQNGNVYIK